MPTYREQVDALLGQSSQAPSSALETSPATPTPTPDPYAIPEGVPYGASIVRHGFRMNLPPPASEVQRQLAVERAKQAQNPAYRMDASGNAIPLMTPEGQPISSKTKIVGTGAITSQQDIQDVVNGIKEGRLPPNPQELSFRDKTRVRAELSRQGVNLSKLETDWNTIQTYAKNSNATQQIRMRQALESVGQSVENLRGLSQEFSRTGWTPANAGIVKAALTGTDPTRRDQATRFMTQITVMRDELAQGFMAGGVPGDRALAMAEEVINPVYGAKQMDAALDELTTNLAIRSNAINSVSPVSMGGMSSQYQGMLGNPGTQSLGRTAQPQGTPSPGIQEGQTATNPKTGARMIYQGGSWQPVK